ncbi:hypothetical protein [Paenibacillus humicus]|uniref:hypothetical protein n=1 Tax=Paenibacillus humicus TaxID=412861 RepID=UPI003F17DDDE
MKTKPKLWLALLLFFIGAVFNLFLTTALHRLLSGTVKTLAFPSFEHSLTSLSNSKPQLLLFLCFQGILAVLSVLFFVANRQPYQSELKQVAPGIETPVPVGQHQHGSARWMRRDEMPRCFDAYLLDLHHPSIQYLIDTGYDDLEFVKPTAKKEGVLQDDTPQECTENEQHQ